MSNNENRELFLDCGIAMSRISSWLDDELALPRNGNRWTYEENGRLCHIILSPLAARTFRNLSLERTALEASGDSEAVDSFERLFTLRFISAGG